MALLFRRASLITSVFRSSVPSFLQPLRSSTVQNFQKKVLSTSILCEKSIQADGDVQTTQVQDTCSDSINARKIHAGSLLNTSQDAVFKYFSKYGAVEMLEFFHTGFTEVHRGFVFVTFSDAEIAQTVLADSDAHIIDGQDITVALPFTDKNVILLVTNVLNATSKEVIAEHFSQFGKVDKVILAHKIDDDVSSYYIIFSSLTAAKKSLKEPTQRIADQGIDSQVMRLSKTQEFKGKTTKLRLTAVPDNLTVDDVRNYFQKFVDLEYVELFKNSQHITELSSNVAYVNFANDSTVEEIVKSENHIIINGSKVNVSKQGNMQGDRKSILRLRVSVEGLPMSAKLWDVKKFFRQTFEIQPSIVCFKRDNSEGKILCVIKFLNKTKLENALKKTDVTFEESPLYFHPLVWFKDGFETEQQ